MKRSARKPITLEGRQKIYTTVKAVPWKHKPNEVEAMSEVRARQAALEQLKACSVPGDPQPFITKQVMNYYSVGATFMMFAKQQCVREVAVDALGNNPPRGTKFYTWIAGPITPELFRSIEEAAHRKGQENHKKAAEKRAQIVPRTIIPGSKPKGKGIGLMLIFNQLKVLTAQIQELRVAVGLPETAAVSLPASAHAGRNGDRT